VKVVNSFLEAIRNLPDNPDEHIAHLGVEEINQQEMLTRRERFDPSWLTRGRPIVRIGW